MKPRLLLVGHSGSRTGAPRVLLDFARWILREGKVAGIQTIFVSGGPIVEEHRRLGWAGTLPRNIGAASVRHRASRVEWEIRLRRRLQPRPDLIWSNTMTNGEVLPLIASAAGHPPVLTHAHELALGTELFTSPSALRSVLDGSAGFVAASRQVRDHLVADRGIAGERVRVAEEFIDVDAVRSCVDRSALRRLLGVGNDTHLIGACGTVDRRKGIDLFIQAAYRLAVKSKVRSRFLFVWIGGGDRRELAYAEHDIQMAGLNARVRMLGDRSDARVLISGLDCLLLTSREDCYPLVMLEAAALSVPVVGFDRAGGSQDFLAGGRGNLVPYLDVDAMADAAVALVEDGELRSRQTECALAFVRENNDLDVGASRLWGAARSLGVVAV